MQGILRFLASRKLAIILLSLTIVGSLVGTTLFDQGKSGDYAKNWWFVTVVIFMLLSTTVCTVQRVNVFLKKKVSGEITYEQINSFDNENYSYGGKFLLTKEGFITSLKKIDKCLHFLGYKTKYYNLSSDKIYFSGIKGKLGFWGSILFHLSFLVIGLGVLYSQAFKFSGDFVLVEGNTFIDYFENYQHRDTGFFYNSNSNHGQFEIKLKDFTPVVSKNQKLKLEEIFSEDYISLISIRDKYDDEIEKKLGVNQTLRYKGYSIVPDYYGHGFAPKIVLKKIPQKGNSGNDGEILLQSHVALNTDLHGSYDNIAKLRTKVTYKDVIELPNLDLKLELNFFPQRPKKGESVIESTAFATDSFLTVRAFKQKATKPFFEGIVDMNKPIDLGPYQLEVTEVKNWQRFLVKSDMGQVIIYLGFFIGVLGLITRIFIYERRLYGLIERVGDETKVSLEEDLEKKGLQKSHIHQVLELLGGQQSDRFGRESFMGNNWPLFK